MTCIMQTRPRGACMPLHCTRPGMLWLCLCAFMYHRTGNFILGATTYTCNIYKHHKACHASQSRRPRVPMLLITNDSPQVQHGTFAGRLQESEARMTNNNHMITRSLHVPRQIRSLLHCGSRLRRESNSCASTLALGKHPCTHIAAS